MNYWITAVLSLIFVAVFGTFTVNIVCNHVEEVRFVKTWGTTDKKGKSIEWFVTRLVAMLLGSLTLSGLTCLIFSVVKLMGG